MEARKEGSVVSSRVTAVSSMCVLIRLADKRPMNGDWGYTKKKKKITHKYLLEFVLDRTSYF